MRDFIRKYAYARQSEISDPDDRAIPSYVKPSTLTINYHPRSRSSTTRRPRCTFFSSTHTPFWSSLL